MSEYRNANDPLRRDSPYDLNASQGGAWTWIAGAVFVVILIALTLGINHPPNNAGPNMAANDTPTLHQPAPDPSGPASRAFTPSVNPSGSNGLTPTPPANQ
jgi:hypothetical protein